MTKRDAPTEQPTTDAPDPSHDNVSTADRFDSVAPIIQPTRDPRRKHPVRHVMVTRDYGLPDVTRMIGDAYHIVDRQLAHFRAEASHEKIDIKGASVLHKLVCVLGILENAENKRISNLQLNSLSKESLELLAEQAAKFGDPSE